MKKKKLQEASTSLMPEVIKQQPPARKVKLKPLKFTKVKTIVKKKW